MASETPKTFLQQLMDKKAAVLRIQAETGKPQTAAIAEVDRQIRQLLNGEKVTKSGPED